MSQTIDTKVVEMKFDNSKFEKNIETSLNSLKHLNESVDKAGKNRGSLDKLADAGNQVGISFDNMNYKAKIGLNMMDMLSGVGTKAFNKISDAVAGFALNMANSLSGMQAMRDGFAEYELKMGSVQTILAGAKIFDSDGNSIEDEARRLDIVNQKLEDLNRYSDKTIYSFKDMTSNIGKFTNAGVSLDDSVQAIQGVANVAAVSGANANEASRAMYNFSQALSSGAVKLIDWKSIENANMATVEFKQQLLDTAVALGTVVKEGELYKTTTTDAQGKVSDWFNSTTKFNDALSNQWMTTEVLTQTLKNYSTDVSEMTDNQLKDYRDALLEIGYTTEQVEGIIKLSGKAFSAATEVKTFTQMIDTLKESLGSGWAQTFEIILGDFEEAKALWTGLNNVIDGMLSPIGKARNEILKLWKEGGGRTALLDSFKNLYTAVTNILAPLKELWKAFTPNKENSGKVLISLTNGIKKLTELIVKASEKIAKVLSVILKPVIFIGNKISAGLIKLVGIVKTKFKAIIDFFKPVSDAIKKFGTIVSEAFNNHIVSRIRTFHSSISELFNNLKKRVNESATVKKLVDAFSKLKNVLSDLLNKVLRNAGIYADRFVLYLGKIWKALAPIVSSAISKTLTKLSDIILPKLRKALDWVSEKIQTLGKQLSKIDIKNSKFYKGLSSLPDKIKILTKSTKLDSIFSTIKGFGSEAVGFLANKFKNLKSNLESIKMPRGLSDVFSNIKNFIKSVFGKDSILDEKALGSVSIESVADEKSGKNLTHFQKFLDSLSNAFEWFRNAVSNAKDAVANFINFIRTNTPKALKAFHAFIAGDDGIFTISDISDMIYTMSDAFSRVFESIGIKEMGDAASNMGGTLSELTEQITKLVKATSNKMKMNALKDFAIGVGILSASLFLLAQLPTGKLIAAGVALGILGYGLAKFFEMISTGNMNLYNTAGFIPVAVFLLSIGGAMIGIATSIGMLVLALKAFPSVIKSYNNLGEEFRTGMDRVKEVLLEIFEYLDHSVISKYSLRNSLAILVLVKALSDIRKTIVKFANEKTGDAMKTGLTRIKEVLTLLGDFLESVSIASFNGINIGINFNTLGMAAMIWAMGNMITSIQPAISEMAKLTPGEFKTAFGALEIIFFEFAGFLTTMSIVSRLTGTGLGKWLGIALNVGIISTAIGSAVSSLTALAKLSENHKDGFKSAMIALGVIFLEFGGLLTVIGIFKPTSAVGTLFGMSLAIGAMTACVVALVPLANSHPEELKSSVIAIGALMIALGTSLFLIGAAGDSCTVGDILKLIFIVGALSVLTMAIRRLSRTGGDSDSITAAGVAISLALISIGGAIKLLSGVTVPISVIVTLGILTAAIWLIVSAIKAFKGATGEMSQSVDQADANIKKTVASTGKAAEEAMGVETEKLAAVAKDAFPPIFDEALQKLGEKIRSFDLGSFLREKFEQLKADAKNWAQDFIDIGTNLIEGIATALEKPENIERIKSCMVELGKAIVSAFKAFLGINSPSTVMAEQGGFVIDGLVQGLMKYPEKLAGWIIGIGTFITEGISNLVTGAKEKGSEFIQNLGEGIQNGKDFVVKKASELGTAASEKVGQAKEWAAKAEESATSFGNKLVNSKNPVKKAAGNMILGAVSSLNKAKSIFKASASEAAGKFSSEIKAGSSPAKAAAKAMVTGAKSAFTNIKNSFMTFGRNAAEGFKEGIHNMISKIADKAREMVKKAKDAAKSEQHSNSPSKDFMEYGGWAAQGYALGLVNRKSTRLIAANASKMVDSAKGIASSTTFGFSTLGIDSNPALNSLAYAMAQISDTIDENIDANPRIKPVIDMSNVNRNASAISSMFGDRQINANINAARHAQNDFNDIMTAKTAAMSTKSIDKLSRRIDDMTNAMNSRTLNVYNTIDGASNPDAFADQLVRSFRLNARTI